MLESKSTTGAYKITAQPGVETLTDVELTLFPRAEMRVVGIAPLTSMFLFDETNRGRLDDYRPEVHDSDGLQIATKSGEHLFRPLANPLKLQVSSFTTQVPQGFGLVQRSRQQSDFEDFDAQYERRPSAWITPKGDWGPGAVELVEIPSGRETNDNIVAFWRPAQALPPGHPAQFAYRIIWCAEPPLPKGLGKVIATRSGASIDRKRRVFLLDIVGAGEKLDGLRLDLECLRRHDFQLHAGVERRIARPARQFRDRSQGRRSDRAAACGSCAATRRYRKPGCIDGPPARYRSAAFESADCAGRHAAGGALSMPPQDLSYKSVANRAASHFSRRCCTRASF